MKSLPRLLSIAVLIAAALMADAAIVINGSYFAFSASTNSNGEDVNGISHSRIDSSQIGKSNVPVYSESVLQGTTLILGISPTDAQAFTHGNYSQTLLSNGVQSLEGTFADSAVASCASPLPCSNAQGKQFRLRLRDVLDRHHVQLRVLAGALDVVRGRFVLGYQLEHPALFAQLQQHAADAIVVQLLRRPGHAVVPHHQRRDRSRQLLRVSELERPAAYSNSAQSAKTWAGKPTPISNRRPCRCPRRRG